MRVGARVGVTAIVAGAACAALALLAADPARCRWFPPCPLHAATGWYCPGCGTLRGLHALLHGDVGSAWSSNPLMVLLLPVVAVGLADEASRVLRARPLVARRVPAAVIWALFVVVVVFGIARNVPAFAVLAPH